MPGKDYPDPYKDAKSSAAPKFTLKNQEGWNTVDGPAAKGMTSPYSKLAISKPAPSKFMGMGGMMGMSGIGRMFGRRGPSWMRNMFGGGSRGGPFGPMMGGRHAQMLASSQQGRFSGGTINPEPEGEEIV